MSTPVSALNFNEGEQDDVKTEEVELAIFPRLRTRREAQNDDDDCHFLCLPSSFSTNTTMMHRILALFALIATASAFAPASTSAGR